MPTSKAAALMNIPVVHTLAALAFGSAAAVAGLLLRRHGEQIREIQHQQGAAMAKFDQLNQDIADLRAGVGELAGRVEAALEAATGDDADQAAVDAAHGEIRTAIDQMKAIAAAPAPEPEPAPEPAPEPTSGTDNGF